MSNMGARANSALEANAVIVANLRELADILEEQEADGFRVMAYRRAADTLASLPLPVEPDRARETPGHIEGERNAPDVLRELQGPRGCPELGIRRTVRGAIRAHPEAVDRLLVERIRALREESVSLGGSHDSLELEEAALCSSLIQQIVVVGQVNLVLEEITAKNLCQKVLVTFVFCFVIVCKMM